MVIFEAERFKSCIEFGFSLNAYDAWAGDDADAEASDQVYFKKFNTLANLRKWYFEWHFNDFFSILAGREAAPTNFGTSEQGFYGENTFWVSNHGMCSGGRKMPVHFSRR